MTYKRRKIWRLFLSAITTLASPAALSQDPPVGAPETPAIEEVIVTARKAAEDVQDIPMSVQVLTADLLDVTDPTHFFDLQFNVPGLVVSNLGHNGAGFSLRGIADQGGSSLSVANHLDGVYLGTSNLSLTRMFDLERIEVLKGPQGTLYGRNATGGSINFVTRLPEREFSAAMEVAYGSYDTGRAQGHINLPFDLAALRLSFIVSEGDGYIRNSVDDRKFAEKDFHGLRASLSIPVSERLKIDIMAQHVTDDGAAGELWLPNPEFLADPSDIRLTTVTLPNPFLESDSDHVSINFEYDLGFATLHSVTGYAKNEINDVDDCAGMPFLGGCIRSLMPGKHDQLSQELRLNSTGGTSVDWIVGAYYYDDRQSRDYFQFTPVINPNPTTDSYTTATETIRAVFGQAAWHFADALSLTAGVRLNHEDHHLTTVGTGTDDSPTPVGAEYDWDNQSWRLDLEYTVTDTMLAYAGVSTGFKSGGINLRPGGIPDSFGPETLTAYEAGIKSQWHERRITLNAATFYYDFRDLQVSTFTFTDDGLVFETDNAAKAEIYGIDADGVLRLGDRLSVSGGVVWLPKREFVEYRNDQTGDTLSGNDLTRSPEWTATIALDYDRPLGRIGSLSARLEYHYRSDFFYTTANISTFAQDGFEIINLYLGFEPASENWYAFASGRNLGDEDYFNQVFLQASPGYPDTWEAGFGIRF